MLVESPSMAGSHPEPSGLVLGAMAVASQNWPPGFRYMLSSLGVCSLEIRASFGIEAGTCGEKDSGSHVVRRMLPPVPFSSVRDAGLAFGPLLLNIGVHYGGSPRPGGWGTWGE